MIYNSFCKIVLAGVFFCMMWPAFHGVAAAQQIPAKFKTLIITGADPAHQWKTSAATAKEILAKTGKFESDIVTNYQILDSADSLAKYDAIVLIGAFQEKHGFSIAALAQTNLLNFVKNGKGFYAQHLASSSWQNWEEFSNMCGRRWINGKSGHPKREPFEVKILNTDHPITRGIKNFTHDDECYGNMGVFRDVTVLATGRSPADATVDQPMIMVNNYGKGRVVINNLGHDKKAQTEPEVTLLIARCVEWAATGRVETPDN